MSVTTEEYLEELAAAAAPQQPLALPYPDEEWMDTDKPRMRGVLHAACTLTALAGGLMLIFMARGGAEIAAAAVYMASALLLFGVSAVYHLGNWNRRQDKVLQLLDHSNIFVFIAGTYTPIAVGVLHGASMIVLISLIWSIALLGVGLGIFALKTPRWVQAGLYVAMGWIAVGWLPALWVAAGFEVPLLLLLGGLVYTLGAVVYAKKRPDPSPRWFGYHEVFHACTVVAAVLHWVAIYLSVR
ncbi:MAG: hemolysin III family protein [Propionibacteriaceae bacterium]|nr:hemolysin III family protein [Propionibacteriaceae bacterium]